jgi:hypothetical protein
MRSSDSSVQYRGRILKRSWDESLKSLRVAFHSHLYSTNEFYSPIPPQTKSGLKLVGNVKIVYENLKSERSQDYARETTTKLYVHEFGFRTVVTNSYCTNV